MSFSTTGQVSLQGLCVQCTFFVLPLASDGNGWDRKHSVFEAKSQRAYGGSLFF